MIFVQGVFSSWPPSVQNKNENGQKDHYWMITHRRDNFAGEVFCKALLLIPIQLLSDCCTSRQSFDTCTMYSYPKGLRAESTGAVTGRRCPHSGEGEDFLTGQLDFFYENCSNSGTESRKIDPKVGNERPLRGLQMGHWPKLGSYGKNWIFGPKTEISGPKKRTFFEVHHVLATPGKSC